MWNRREAGSSRASAPTNDQRPVLEQSIKDIAAGAPPVKLRKFLKGRWRLISFPLLLWALVAAGQAVVDAVSDDPEIALLIGERWDDMRQRSTASIDPAIPGHYWGRHPKTDARLRLVDPQYGFVTPTARFFSVRFHHERVSGLRMSPQVEPLLLDDALKVFLDIQDQWRKAGWTLIWPETDPAIENTPEWRARLRDPNKGGTTYWQAGDKYQALFYINRFKDVRKPDEERYLITLNLAKPWLPADVKYK